MLKICIVFEDRVSTYNLRESFFWFHSWFNWAYPTMCIMRICTCRKEWNTDMYVEQSTLKHTSSRCRYVPMYIRRCTHLTLTLISLLIPFPRLLSNFFPLCSNAVCKLKVMAFHISHDWICLICVCHHLNNSRYMHTFTFWTMCIERLTNNKSDNLLRIELMGRRDPGI